MSPLSIIMSSQLMTSRLLAPCYGVKVLVEIVKLAQKREMKGNQGGWKDFLKFYDKKFGSSLSDPAKRSADVLAAFLKTFSQKEDLKVSNREDLFNEPDDKILFFFSTLFQYLISFKSF